jgi:hypothetical protein
MLAAILSAAIIAPAPPTPSLFRPEPWSRPGNGLDGHGVTGLKITADTEIMLDGRQATLDDIKDGHEVIRLDYNRETRVILRMYFRTRH